MPCTMVDIYDALYADREMDSLPFCFNILRDEHIVWCAHRIRFIQSFVILIILSVKLTN